MKLILRCVLLLCAFLSAAPLVFAQAPANDNFADRIILSGALPIHATGSNVGATKEAGEPSHYYAGQHSVWWSWTADRDRVMSFNNSGTNFDGVTAIYESTIAGEEIVMDNADATGVTVTGDWATSTATAGYSGQDYLDDGNAGKGTKSVRFTPTIGSAGNYDVYLWWPASTNLATDVPVDVTYAGGTKTFHVNQRAAGGGWVQINTGGSLLFDAGATGSVLVRTDSATDGAVIADAVRLVPAPGFSDLSKITSSDYDLTFAAKAGHTYQIAFDGWLSYQTGTIGFDLREQPAITSAIEAFATVNEQFSFQITTNFSATSYYVSGLPAGLTYDYLTGIISGIPTATPGSYYVYLTAYGSTTVYGNLTIILGTLAPTVTSPTSASASQGKPFTYQITATHDPTSFSTSSLPSGLTLDTMSGVISGTPSVFGSWTITLSAANSYGAGVARTLYLDIADGRPSIVGPYSVAAVQGQPLSFQIDATNSPTRYSASYLPAGLTLDAITGLVTGTPTGWGYASVYVSAQNTYGTGSGGYIGIAIEPAFPTVTAGSERADVGQPFTYQIIATKSPTGYAAVGLPAGLTIDTATGAIAGTPTVSGFFDVEISATNSYGTGSNNLFIAVYTVVADNFADRLPLRGSAVSLYATNDGATKEEREPNHAGDEGGASVWWTWTAPKSGQYRVTLDADFDAIYTIYQGSSLRGLTPVVDNRDYGQGRQNPLFFEAAAGGRYVIAVDGSGGSTGSFGLKIEWIGRDVAKILTVTTTAGGTVTPGFLGTSYRRLGETLTVEAKPAPGFLFSSWDLPGGSSSSRKISFSMQDTMAMQANFVPSPFVASRGCYYGLIQSSSHTASSSGVIKFTLDGTGAFTASIRFGGRSYSLRGIFDVAQALQGSAQFDAVIPRGAEWPLMVSLFLDLTNPGEPLTGSIEDDVVSASINAGRSGLNAKTNPAPQAGRYTLLGTPTDSSIPQGTGYGVALVNAAGIVRFTGVLPDGRHVMQSAQLTDSGSWPFYLALDSGEGLVSGYVELGDGTGNSLTADLQWLKPPKPHDPFYPDGFSGGISFSGGRYAPPPAGNRVLDFGNEDGIGSFSFDDPGVFGISLAFPIALHRDNTVTATDPQQRFALTIAASSGFFSGRVTDPVTAQSYPFAGVVVQPGVGGGLFKLGGQTSSVLLQP